MSLLASLLLASAGVQAAAPSGPAAQRPRAVASWVDPARLVLDGDGTEWRGERPPDVVIDRAEQLVALGARPPIEGWSGPQDASLRLWVGWNEVDLVLCGEVLDEVEEYVPAAWHRGDSLELFLSTVDRAPTWGPDDFQVMLAPAWEDRPWGFYPHEGSATAAPDGGFGGVDVVSQLFLGGYRFEARLPWRNFAGHRPRAGEVLPFNFALCDRDGRGEQESYGTWTGEAGIAAWADRRGELVLAARPDARAGATTTAPPSQRPRVVLLVLLAATYLLALATRRLWRHARARRGGLLAAGLVLAAAAGVSLLARVATRSENEGRLRAVADYWEEFEAVLDAGALGHPESDDLRRRVTMLLAGEAVPATPQRRFQPLTLATAELAAERATAQRGIPYRPIEVQGAQDSGVVLGVGGELVLELSEPRDVDAVLLVTQVADPRSLRAGTEQVSVLAVELELGEEPLGVAREVRHRQDLHYQEDEHRAHPGTEPAFYAPGGRLGRVHGDGILLELEEPVRADHVRLRRVGPTAYDVRVIAVSVRSRGEEVVPAGMRATPDGGWQWAGRRPQIAAEVTPPGRAPRRSGPDTLQRLLRLGLEPVGQVYLRDTTPAPRSTRWDFLPIGTASFLSPFLVALLAEWLATRRRIRGKLAVGFAVSSAVPLLALTLLLDASLRQERKLFERERAQAALVRAEKDLESEQRALEREAARLLRIAELERKVRGAWPSTSAELADWWGAAGGSVRFLERVAPDGRRLRVGTGPHWREVPRDHTFVSGLQRPWGHLWICGVARTASGAEEPLAVVVASTPGLPDSLGAQVAASPGGTEGAVDLRLVGAGRDPRPRLEELAVQGPRELRRALFGPLEGELVGVLVASWGQRGVPVLGDYTLTELLLAAGISALFTALLFAGILTGHLVGPIERLDRALREGRATEVVPEVDDEIGHLTGAIRSATSELDHRLRQLETLRVAHEDLSRQLDAERARGAVLRFFDLHGGARTAWLLWAGDGGEAARLYGLDGHGSVRSQPVPEGPGLIARALVAGRVLHLRDARGLPALGEAERNLLGPVERVLSLPLSAAGGTRGALLLGFLEADAAPDLAFLRAAAGQAAIVLENARLYQQAVSDGVTGFLFDPAFRQRLAEEIQRAEEHPGAGVLVVQLRLARLPEDDRGAADRLREAAQRMRMAVRGLAVFGRSGSADLKVAIPWTRRRPGLDALEQRIVDRVAASPWADGEPVEGLLSAHAAWPLDGPSGRFVLHRLEERLASVRTGLPAPSLASLRDQLPPDFVAGSANMVQVLETVRRLAQQEVTLLVSGETGTGKDRIAELVHRWSARHGGPLVHIHCPSLSAGLIEDELFGHEKGAFTGAHTRRVGPFEYAAGGTVVLDEVGGLSYEGQVALLRLLETREVLPLGAHKPVPIDVRIVATSSRDLAGEVEAGRFRSDLYFRLNVAQVTLPPLRLRRQALPDLVAAFVRRFNASADRPVTGVDPEVLDLLFEHEWPGNVRELENVLARGLILAAGTELRPEHVDLESLGDPSGPQGEVAGLNPRQESLLEGLAVGESIRSVEHAARHGISGRTALRDLLDLAERGWLAREGERRGTRFRRLARSPRTESVQ